MTDTQLPNQSKSFAAKKVIAYVLWIVVAVLLSLIVGLALLAHSDKGSRWLLEQLMSRQSLVDYQYEKGNIADGLSLKNISVRVKDIEVKIDHASVTPGWRSLVSREMHFMRVNADLVQVIDHVPSTGQPFKFSQIKLPLNLRINRGQVKQLQIITSTSKVAFYQIKIKDALWDQTKISVKQADLAMDYLRINNVVGSIDFRAKYPISAKAELVIPSLKALNADKIQIVAAGDLDTLRAGAASSTPDIISGYVIGHPMRKGVPMTGQLYWKHFRWPLLDAQKLYSEQGKLLVHGDLSRLNLDLDTDLSADGVPKGQYQANMYTDLKQLRIEQLIGEVMQGQIDLHGVVDWQKGVTWDAAGRIEGLNTQDAKLAELAQQYLPKKLSASVNSQGDLTQGTSIDAEVALDQNETWQMQLSQQAAKKPQPWLIALNWKNFDREMPYVGWLKSQSGEVKLNLSDLSQDIVITSDVQKVEQSWLPQGHYSGRLSYRNNDLQVKSFAFQDGLSQLQGNAVVNLPRDTRSALKWSANLQAQQFNPQSLLAEIPVDVLNGSLKGHGTLHNNQLIIQLQAIDLQGQLGQNLLEKSLKLQGNSTIALILNDKGPSALHSYALIYDGTLASDQLPAGPLSVKLSGTPELLKISNLYHQGPAGQINARGMLNLAGGMKWDLSADLQQFKPEFFISSLQGDLTGSIRSRGQWSGAEKNILIEKLNLHGQLNNKPVLGQGNLSLSFDAGNKILPQQLSANNLLLSYAQNVLHVTGNAQRLQLNVNAPNLQQLYSSLRGTIKGFIAVQTKPQLDAQANLLIENFRFANLLQVSSMSLKGRLPTGDQATRLLLEMQKLRSGDREISQAKIDMLGTRSRHVIDFVGENQLSKFNLRLAGGLTAQNDWYGQLKNGWFDSKRTQLKQDQAAAVIYNRAKNQLSIGIHCWMSRNNLGNQICVDQPMLISPSQGAVSVKVKDIELGDFQAFMPVGLAITGKINGYTHLSWLNQQAMQFDSQFLTENGSIALTNDAIDSEDLTQSKNTTSLRYNQIRLAAKTTPAGLSLKINGDTPALGTGALNVLIGHQLADKSLSGDIVLDKVKLNIFKPFISDVRVLDGQLSAAGRLSGTLAAPAFNGEVRLKDGRIAMISLPIDWRNIQLQSSIQNHQAKIVGGFNAGRGVAKITGSADWSSAARIQLRVDGQQLLVAQPPTMSAVISPGLDIDIRPNIRQLTVNGNIEIPRAVIAMPESSATAINTSADVRVIKQSDDQLAIIRAARPWNIRANIAVNLGQQVIFRGFNSVIPLAGRVQVSQRGTELNLRSTGAIGVSRQVKIDAYGQSLDLKRAIARFNGDLVNPTLDMDASKDVDNYTIGVRITGVANRPAIQIYNDAGLSEQEALNALIAGRISSGSSSVNNTEGFKSDINNTLAAAGISMGLGGTRALTNQIGRSFGLSGLALDAQGSGSNTLVNVTGYITPDLYLRYGVGIFTPVNKLTLRYQVNRRLYMEASSSVERAVDIFYNWRF